jgi:hypothetical protein
LLYRSKLKLWRSKLRLFRSKPKVFRSKPDVSIETYIKRKGDILMSSKSRFLALFLTFNSSKPLHFSFLGPFWVLYSILHHTTNISWKSKKQIRWYFNKYFEEHDEGRWTQTAKSNKKSRKLVARLVLESEDIKPNQDGFLALIPIVKPRIGSFQSISLQTRV